MYKRHYRPKFRPSRRAEEIAVRRVNVLTRVVPVHYRQCFHIIKDAAGEVLQVLRAHRRTEGVRTNYGALQVDRP